MKKSTKKNKAHKIYSKASKRASRHMMSVRKYETGHANGTTFELPQLRSPMGLMTLLKAMGLFRNKAA